MKYFIIILICLIVLYGLIELFEHKVIAFKKVKLKSDLGNRVIGVFSDVHSYKISDRVITRILMQAPDIIIIAGDLINTNQTEYDRAIDLIEKLSVGSTVVYCMGNHEIKNRRYNPEGFKTFVDRIYNSCIILDDRVANIAGLNIGGVSLDCDVYSKGKRKPVPIEYISGLVDKGFKKCDILVSHNPEYSMLFTEKFAPKLILSGHLHGGHIRLPFIGGILFTTFPVTKYRHGLYTEKDTDIYVSAGLGNHFIPMRFLNRCEVSFLSSNFE